MSVQVTLEQAEQIAVQLPPRDQLKLVAYLSERLSATPVTIPLEERSGERAKQRRLAQMEAWIAQCDQVAELWEGEFDSAADLRRIRDEG